MDKCFVEELLQDMEEHSLVYVFCAVSLTAAVGMYLAM